MTPESTIPPPTTAHLQSLPAIRSQCHLIYTHVTYNKSKHFCLDESKLSSVADFVINLMERDYGKDGKGMINTLSIRPHSRWRHYPQGEIDKLTSPLDDNNEKCKLLLDLFTVSVLLDAGAGTAWRYVDEDGVVYTRSEGLALATLRMFQMGLFGENKVSADHLSKVTVNDIASGLQVTDTNPIVGLDGRVQLLRNLSKALTRRGLSRPSDFLDHLLDVHGNHIPLDALWSVVMNIFAPSGLTPVD